MKLGKINIKVGKMKLKAVKVFIEPSGRITIIDDNKNKLNSYGNEKVYLYVENGYISWKQTWKENKNNKIQGEEIKTNGRANI